MRVSRLRPSGDLRFRYDAYARDHGMIPEQMRDLDRACYPDAMLTPFFHWLSGKKLEWSQLNPGRTLQSGKDQLDFERWLGELEPKSNEVSATECMENRGSLRDWEKLLVSLYRLVEGSGQNLVRAACNRGLQRLGEQLLAVISEERDALQRPIEESERRVELMKETISEAERSMRELSFLFMAEQQRISDLFLERRRRFFGSAWKESEAEFSEKLPSIARGLGPRYRRRLMRFAQEISRRRVMPWLKPEQEEGERQYRAVAIRFVEIGNNFLKKLADAGMSELTRMPHALDPDKGFRVRSRFTFEDFIGTAQPASPLRWIADLVLPLVGARNMITHEAREFLQYLLEVNSARVQNDIFSRIQESRGYLEIEIRKLLHEISRIAEQALNRARRIKEVGTPAVQSAMARLNRFEQQISALM